MLDAGAMKSAASCQEVDATVRFPCSESYGRRAKLFGRVVTKHWGNHADTQRQVAQRLLYKAFNAPVHRPSLLFDC